MSIIKRNPLSATGEELQRGVDPDVLKEIGYPVPEHLLNGAPETERSWRLTEEQKQLGKEAIKWLRTQYPDLDSRKR